MNFWVMPQDSGDGRAYVVSGYRLSSYMGLDKGIGRRPGHGAGGPSPQYEWIGWSGPRTDCPRISRVALIGACTVGRLTKNFTSVRLAGGTGIFSYAKGALEDEEIERSFRHGGPSLFYYVSNK